MGRCLLLAFLGAALLSQGASPSRAPVLVELFTSEGCSSCPPADRLLEQLDPQAIVLSEHVDYWNHDGWKDPFSSADSTLRQDAYRRRFNLDSAYTPEMVVDGAAEFSGGLADRAAQEIAKAAGQPKTAVRITRTAAGFRVETDAAAISAGIFMALADDSGVSQVSAGENQGRQLHHVAIVRSIRKIGSVKPGAAFSQVVKLPESAAAQRIVVFIQESGEGRVRGAAMLPPYTGSH
jgi:hypothetical protein